MKKGETEKLCGRKRSTFHFRRSDNGSNPLERWVQTHAGLFQYNPFKPETHKDILTYFPCCAEQYHDAINKWTHVKGTLTARDQFLILAHSVARQRIQECRQPVQTDRVVAVLDPVEGLHRRGTMQCLASKSDFGVRLKSGSISTSWVEKMLCSNPQFSRSDVTKNLDGVDIGKLIDTAMEKPDSFFHRPVAVKLHYGVTAELIDTMGLTMDQIQRCIRKESKRCSDTKTNSSTPPITFEMGEALKMLIDVMEDNEEQLNQGEQPTHSGNGDGYLKYVQPSQPEEFACPKFDTEEFRSFMERPCQETMEDWFRDNPYGVTTIDMGKREGSRQECVADRTVNGPFAPTSDRVLKLDGCDCKFDQKRKDKWNSKGPPRGWKTGSQLFYLRGDEHAPMHIEEAVRIAAVVLTFQYFFRIRYGIAEVSWEASPMKDRYKGELLYLVQHHCQSSSSLLYGRIFLADKKEVKWSDAMSRYGRMTLSDTNLADPKNRHQAGALLLAEQLIGALQEPGFGTARDLVNVLCNVHDDMEAFNSSTFMNILGKRFWVGLNFFIV